MPDQPNPVSVNQEKKALRGLRTFADDVKRVQAAQRRAKQTDMTTPAVDPSAPQPPDSEIAPPPIAPPPAPEQSLPPPPPAPLPTPPPPDSSNEQSTAKMPDQTPLTTAESDALDEAVKTKPVPRADHAATSDEAADLPPPPSPQTTESETELLDVPPFHSLVAKSAEETDFGSAEADTTPDTKPQIPTIPTKKIQVPKGAVAAEMDNFTAAKDSVLVRDGIFHTEEAQLEGGEGSIVTDKKSSRFKLFPAIAAAFKKWFGSKTDAIVEARKPKKEIVRASRRADIIKAAAERAKHAPTDDHVRVRERLKDVERITETEDLQIKDKTAVPEPSWTHTEEQTEVHDQAIASLEEAVKNPEEKTSAAPEAHESVHKSASEASLETSIKPSQDDKPEKGSPSSIAAVEPPKPDTGEDTQATAAPKPTATKTPENLTEESTPASPAAPAPSPQTTVQTKQTPAPRHVPPTAIPSPPTPQSAPTQAVSANTRDPLPAASPAQATGYGMYRDRYGDEYVAREDTFAESLPPQTQPTAPADQVGTQPRRQPVPNYRLNRADQPIPQTTGMPLLPIAAVSVVAIVLGVGVSVWWFTRAPEATTVTEAPVVTPSVSTQPLSPIEISNPDQFLSELRNQLNAEGGDREFFITRNGITVSPDTLFTELGWRAPGSFARAISQITVGSKAGEPYLVLRITSFDNAFGGILAWENVMATDLAPLFGPPEATTVRDARIANRDVRVLLRADQTDKITYGFINKNLILITTDRNTYASIAADIQ